MQAFLLHVEDLSWRIEFVGHRPEDIPRQSDLRAGLEFHARSIFTLAVLYVFRRMQRAPIRVGQACEHVGNGEWATVSISGSLAVVANSFHAHIHFIMSLFAETTTMSIKIQWPMPAHWEDFEDMCYRLALAEGTIVSGRKFGRRGQEQHGVDIVGKADLPVPINVGIQCKLKTEYLGGELRAAELIAVYDKTKSLKPQLDKLYVATTIARDTEISLLVDQMNASWQRRHFIEVWCWEDICEMLEAHQTVAARFYPGFVNRDELQRTPGDLVELFLGPGSTEKIRERLTKLYEHVVFKTQFGDAQYEVGNVLTEYVLNRLHGRKGNAKRMAITLDGTDMVIEDDGDCFDPLNNSVVTTSGQMGLRTIQGLAKSQPGLRQDYFPRDADSAQAFNRFVIRVMERECIASRSCTVHFDAADLFSRHDGHTFFEKMNIPPECDPFKVMIGTSRHSSSSGTHEVLRRLIEYLGSRKLVVVVAPHRPDLYAALEDAVAHWPNVSMQMR